MFQYHFHKWTSIWINLLHKLLSRGPAWSSAFKHQILVAALYGFKLFLLRAFVIFLCKNKVCKINENYTPHKILIIEDDKDITNLLAINLQDMGYEVKLAHDGQVGLELTISDQFNLVILDVMLPKIDGLEICRRIRSVPVYTPILILT